MARTIPNEEKVFMVSKNTNTTYSGSAALKAMSEWYTMEDVSNTVKPYKVFTALLSQSGESQPFDVYEGTTLSVGYTYLILSSGEGATGDFTNVGAPNNEDGTFFIATGTTPNSWGISYLQYDSGAPVATVLENTIGNIWLGYGDTGIYFPSSDGLFTLNKTTVIFGGVFISPFDGASIGYGKADIIYNNFPNSFAIECVKTQDGLRVNDALRQTTIEIRVYN